MKPVIQHIYEDLKYKLFGNPLYEEYKQPKEILPVFIQEGDKTYADPALLYGAVLGPYSPPKSVPGGKKSIEKELEAYGFPKVQKYDKKDRVAIEPMWFLSGFNHILNPDSYEGILGYYSFAPGAADLIHINREFLPNAKQHLALGQTLDQVAKKQVKLDADKEDLFFKTIYSAVVTNGFLPKDSLEDFKRKVLSDAKYRDRTIKALALPAYATALHEAIHRKYIKNSPKYDKAYVYPKYTFSPAIGFSFNLLYDNGFSEQTLLNLIRNLDYAATPTEMDAQLSLMKIWYYIQTGKKIKSIKDAERAMNVASLFAAKNRALLINAFPDVIFQTTLYGFNNYMLNVFDNIIKSMGKDLEPSLLSTIQSHKKTIENFRLLQLYRLAQL